MYERWIVRRERAYHDEVKTRVSLPFEWGTEHLGLGGVDALDALVARAAADGDDFFSTPPYRGPYDFDGTLLRFPSAYPSQYPANDTVVGRFFPSGRRLAAIVTPEWTATWDSHVSFCRLLARCGITALRLSAPYHHARMPDCLQRPEFLVSANVGRTIAAVRQGVADVRRAADWLGQQGYERIAVVGTSAGALISFLAFVHDRRLCSGTFLMLSSIFADVVWRGMSTEHVRAGFGDHITLEALRRYWAPLSPLTHMHRLTGDPRPSLFISGSYDPTCVPELTRLLFASLDENRVRCSKLWLPCGHHTMATFPFNIIVTVRVLAFLLGAALALPEVGATAPFGGSTRR